MRRQLLCWSTMARSSLIALTASVCVVDVLLHVKRDTPPLPAAQTRDESGPALNDFETIAYYQASPLN